jgi:hypothetical protein
MSNETLENAKAKGKKGLRWITALNPIIIIPALFVAASYFGVLGMAWNSSTALINGAEIVQITAASETTRKGMVEECDANGSCRQVPGQIKIGTISLTHADGTPMKMDNTDMALFWKYNTNDVDALARDLAKNASAGKNDYAVIYSSGFRQALPDWIIEDGINRKTIELYEYMPDMTEAEYDALPSSRQKRVKYGKVGHFSFHTYTWIGIAIGLFAFVQLLCMALSSLLLSIRGRMSWGLFFGPVGLIISLIGRRIKKRRAKRAAA